MPRRSFTDLSDSYRARLQRAGITPEAYEAGASLSAARGHGATPERPLADLENVPEKYRSYAEIRKEILQLKEEIFHPTGRNWKRNQLIEMYGKSRKKLEKGRDVLAEMRGQVISWDGMRAMHSELEDKEWDWIGHYH